MERAEKGRMEGRRGDRVKRERGSREGRMRW